MTLDTDISWPTTIPLPHVDYSGEPQNATVFSDIATGSAQRRSRFERSYLSVSVTWNLTSAEYVLFQDFFLSTLGNGAAQFKIELRYPKNTALTYWSVRFMDTYQPSYDDGIWTITAGLDVVNPIEF